MLFWVVLSFEMRHVENEICRPFSREFLSIYLLTFLPGKLLCLSSRLIRGTKVEKMRRNVDESKQTFKICEINKVLESSITSRTANLSRNNIQMFTNNNDELVCRKFLKISTLNFHDAQYGNFLMLNLLFDQLFITL